MPQSGFHGLVGLATSRALIARVPSTAQVGFAFGTVLGAVLPDIDLYPAAVAALVDPKHATEELQIFHRTAAHSIFVVVLFALMGFPFGGNLKLRWTLWGLSIGVLTHEVLDVFFWFAKIDIMWPFSHWPAHWFATINIWAPHDKQLATGLAPNLRDACEFPAFALFLAAIRSIVTIQGRPQAALTKQIWWERMLWVYFLVALIGSFLNVENPQLQQKIIFVPILLAVLPYCWSRIWVYREEIAAWSRRPSVAKEEE